MVTRDTSSPVKHVLALLFIVVVLLFAYVPVLANGFVDWDDMQNFVNNPWIKVPGVEALWWALKSTHLGVFQPLSWLAIEVETWIFGLRPSVFHTVSLVLHLAIACCLYGLTTTLVRHAYGSHDYASQRAGRPLALFLMSSAVLWTMLHPLRVEVVAWSSCQPYLLAILCALVGFWLYLDAAWSHGPSQRWKSRLAFVLFLLSCLGKTLILALPIVLLALDYYPLRRFEKEPWTKIIARKTPYFLLSLATLLVGLWAHGKDHPFLSLEELTLSDRIIKVCLATHHYAGSLLSPTRLAAFYPNPPVWQWSHEVFLGLALILALLVLALWSRKKYPGLLATIIITALWLVPHVGIIPTGRVVGADRYTYLAALSLTPLLARGLLMAAEHRRGLRVPLVGMCLGIIAYFAMLTRTQLTTWQDSVSLWTRALDIAGDGHPELFFNVASSLRAANRPREALTYYQRSLAVDPSFEKTLLNLGLLYADLDQPDQALPYYQRLLKIKPQNTAGHGNLGLLYLAKKDAVSAESHLKEAYQLAPDDSDYAFNLAKFYVLTQRPELALDPAMQAAKNKGPDAMGETFLGKVYFEAKRFTEARDAWSRALALASADTAEYRQVKCYIDQIQGVQNMTEARPLQEAPGATLAPPAFVQPWSDYYLDRCRQR